MAVGRQAVLLGLTVAALAVAAAAPAGEALRVGWGEPGIQMAGASTQPPMHRLVVRLDPVVQLDPVHGAMPLDSAMQDVVDAATAAAHRAAVTGVAAVTEATGRVVRHDGVLGFLVVETAMPPEPLAQRLRAVAGVRGVEPDAVVRGLTAPIDALYPAQWGPPAIGAEEAWAVTLGSRDVTVAVLDTGIDYLHVDLRDAICAYGPHPHWETSADDNGHGSHVAGVVAALSDNLVGVAGLSRSCLHVAKVLDNNAVGYASDVATAMADAVARGADIITLSLGGVHSPVLQEAVQHAEASGVLVVAAAGNDQCGPVAFPAAYAEVLSVGAVDRSLQRAGFSSCGPELDLVAPGVAIWSTWRQNLYDSLSGSSMAAPHVAGAAALVMSAFPTLTAHQVRCTLLASARDLGTPGHDDETGYGLVDVAAALERAGLGGAAMACPVAA